MGIVYNWCYAGLAMLALMCMIVAGSPSSDDPDRATVAVAAAGLWRRVADGQMRSNRGGGVVPLRYTWRYLDSAGHDVTDQVLRAGMVVDRAEAVDVDGGGLLLAMHRAGTYWLVCLPGGVLGDQLDGVDFVQEYSDPYEALRVAALRLGLTATEL